MVDYNIQDVVLLEKVYHKLLPWISNHPNMGLYDLKDNAVCPKCGGTHLQWRGSYKTNVGSFKRFQCQSCGGWGRSRFSELTKEQKKEVVTNAAI